MTTATTTLLTTPFREVVGLTHNEGMNLTVRPVTRLAGLPSRRGLERARARRAPARPAGYARRYADSLLAMRNPHDIST